MCLGDKSDDLEDVARPLACQRYLQVAFTNGLHNWQRTGRPIHSYRKKIETVLFSVERTRCKHGCTLASVLVVVTYQRRNCSSARKGLFEIVLGL
jgi:hypothetical protein